MAVNLTLVNAALTRTGNDAITEFSDGSSGGNIAGENYDLIKRAALTSYPWRWAMKTEVLSLLTGTPAPPWLYAYQLPADLYHLRVATVSGQPIEYEVQFNKLLCDADGSSDVIVKYTWDVPETAWPADFAEAFTQQLEALFLRGVGERYEEAEARAKSAARAMQAAKTADAGRASPRDPFVSPTLRARTGLASYPAIPWR